MAGKLTMGGREGPCRQRGHRVPQCTLERRENTVHSENNRSSRRLKEGPGQERGRTRG